MKYFCVTVDVTVIEVYRIKAKDKDDAKERWHEGKLVYQETRDVELDTMDVREET